ELVEGVVRLAGGEGDRGVVLAELLLQRTTVGLEPLLDLVVEDVGVALVVPRAALDVALELLERGGDGDVEHVVRASLARLGGHLALDRVDEARDAGLEQLAVGEPAPK